MAHHDNPLAIEQGGAARGIQEALGAEAEVHGTDYGCAKDRTCVGTVALVDYALLVEAQPASSASRADSSLRPDSLSHQRDC